MEPKAIYHFEVYRLGDRTPSAQYVLMNETFWDALRYATSHLLKNGCEIMVYSALSKRGTAKAAIRFGRSQGMLKRVPGGIFWGTETGDGYIYPSVKDFGTLNRAEVSSFRRS